jgi:mannose-1-phosphate guanylyltransferase
MLKQRRIVAGMLTIAALAAYGYLLVQADAADPSASAVAGFDEAERAAMARAYMEAADVSRLFAPR